MAVKSIDLLVWGRRMDRVLKIVKTDDPLLHKYQVYFKNCNLKMDKGRVFSPWGCAGTVNKTLSKYAKEISEKKLIFDYLTNHQKEVVAPKLGYHNRNKFSAAYSQKYSPVFIRL